MDVIFNFLNIILLNASNFIFFYFGKLEENTLFSPLLNFFEVLILAFTALFSLKAARQASYANELTLLPLLAVYFRDIKDNNKPHSFYKVRIKNLGNGVAYNVKASPIFIQLRNTHITWKLYFELHDTNVIAPGKERTLETTSYANSKETNLDDVIVAYLKSGNKKKPIDVAIVFKNAKGDEYFCITQLGKDKVLIKSPSRRVSLFDRIFLMWLVIYNNLLAAIYSIDWSKNISLNASRIRRLFVSKYKAVTSRVKGVRESLP